jgi:hypothetical protein
VRCDKQGDKVPLVAETRIPPLWRDQQLEARSDSVRDAALRDLDYDRSSSERKFRTLIDGFKPPRIAMGFVADITMVTYMHMLMRALRD